MTQLQIGFASYQKGDFELIIRDRLNLKEVVLTGLMEGNPPFEKIDEVLPTCVYVPAESPQLPSGWFRMLCEATEKLTPADEYVDSDADGYLLEAIDQITEVARDDNCTLYLFTQSELLTLMRTLVQKDPA